MPSSRIHRTQDHQDQYLRPRLPLKPLPPEKAARVDQILARFGVPPDQREDYMDCLAGLVEAALDEYRADWQRRRLQAESHTAQPDNGSQPHQPGQSGQPHD